MFVFCFVIIIIVIIGLTFVFACLLGLDGSPQLLSY